MKSIKFVCPLVLLIVVSQISFAQNAGDLDTTFNSTGKYTYDYGFVDNATNVAVQPADQKIVVSGTALTPAFSGNLMVTRLLPNGTIDNGFGVNGSLVFTNFNESYAYATMIRNDGKILLAGAKADPSFQFSNLVIRLNEDGTIDSTFGINGFATPEISTGDDFAYAAVEQPDHKILLAGTALDAGFNNQPCVVRLLENGSIDSTFGVNGVYRMTVSNNDNELTSIALQSDGKIVVSGHIDNGLTTGGQFDFDILVIRLNSDGTPDATFGTNGITITSNGIENVDDAFGTIVSSTGDILVSGFSTQPNFSYDAILLKYDTTGVLDPAFGIGGIVVFNENDFEVGFDLAEQADGKILFAGNSGNFPPASNDFLLARYLANGSPDPTFGINGRVITSIFPDYDEAEGIALQADGKAILVGKTYNGTQNDIAIARFLTDGPSLLQDMNFAGSPLIAPNPVGANKVIRISNLPPGFDNMELKLLSIDGKQIATKNFQTTYGVDVEFSLPQTMAKGIYVIEITNENSYGFRKKLIVTE